MPSLFCPLSLLCRQLSQRASQVSYDFNRNQIHKNRGRVPRFLYFEREKVSHWELSDVSCSAVPEHLAEKPVFQQLRLKFLLANFFSIVL